MRGDHCDELGWIEWEDHGPILRVQGGGWWRLDLGLRATWKVRGRIGRRVRVTGTREGFNILAARTLEAV